MLGERIEKAAHLSAINLFPMRPTPSPPTIAPISQDQHTTFMCAVPSNKSARHCHRRGRRWQDLRWCHILYVLLNMFLLHDYASCARKRRSLKSLIPSPIGVCLRTLYPWPVYFSVANANACWPTSSLSANKCKR